MCSPYAAGRGEVRLGYGAFLITLADLAEGADPMAINATSVARVAPIAWKAKVKANRRLRQAELALAWH